MTVQYVKVTQQMIGTRNPDLVTYPEVDVQGKEYKRSEVSTRNVGPHQFVVIPSGLDKPGAWEFELPGALHPEGWTGSPVIEPIEHVSTPDVSTFGDMTFDAPADTSADEPFTRKRK